MITHYNAPRILVIITHYNAPRILVIITHYNTPRILVIITHYNAPRILVIITHYNTPRILVVITHYTAPRTLVIITHYNTPRILWKTWEAAEEEEEGREKDGLGNQPSHGGRGRDDGMGRLAGMSWDRPTGECCNLPLGYLLL